MLLCIVLYCVVLHEWRINFITVDGSLLPTLALLDKSLAEPLHSFISGYCRTVESESNVSWFRVKSHNKDSVAD